MKLTIDEIEKHVNRENHTLNLSKRNLTDSEILVVCRYLKFNSDITVLNVSGCQIGVEGARTLSTNTTLTALNIGENKISVVGAKALAMNTTLRSLDILNNAIGVEGAKAFAENKTLTMLDVSWNKLRDAGAIALTANTTISTLNIVSNDIYDLGAATLAANTSITELNIMSNHIGSSGAEKLAANSTLKSLTIANNSIRICGARFLLANTTLTALDIRANYLNYLSSADEKKFISLLKTNKNLIKLIQNEFGECTGKLIKKMLSRNINHRYKYIVKLWLKTVMHARLLAQAQRSNDCSLGTLPTEVHGIINNYVVGANHFSFFMAQFDKRPTAEDLVRAKKMALS